MLRFCFLVRFVFPAILASLLSSLDAVTIIAIGFPPGSPPNAGPDVFEFRTGPGVPVEMPVLANDSDADNDALSIVAVSAPAHGTVAIAGDLLVYTPNRAFFYEDRFTYDLRDATGRGHRGEVVARNPFHLVRGTYETLMETPDWNAGLPITVTVNSSGALSGKGRLNGKLFQLRGTVDFNGSFSGTAQAGEVTITASLQFTTTRLSDLIERWQTVMTGSVPIPHYLLTLKPTEANGLPALASSQRLTLTLDDLGVLELGIAFPPTGYAIGSLSPSGKVRLAGRLPDNQPFSAGGGMKRDGSVIIHAAPHGRRSGLDGQFTLADATDGILHWTSTLHYWFSVPNPARPTPWNPYPHPWLYFSTSLGADLGTYDPSRARAELADPDSESTLNIYTNGGQYLLGDFKLHANLRCAFTEPEARMQLQIDRATGLARGRFFDGAQWQQLRGVLSLPFGIGRGMIVPKHGEGGQFYIFPGMAYETLRSEAR